jgi:predicted nucleic acid-binding protein
MRLIVSDSSCLIDLRKASLLDAFLKLPYEILIPNTLFDGELLKFTSAQKKALVRGGLKVMDLPGERVLRAQQVVRGAPQLSIHDGFAFALAETYTGCVLLTGDGSLRALAAAHHIEVHGVLWVVDEIHGNKVGTAASLHAALLLLADDPAARLPRRELAAAIKRYDGLRVAR